MRLIDADAMLETLKRKYPQWYTRKPKDSWMHYVCLVYYWAVREAPTIDAVPIRHGHWVDDAGALRCSECGVSFPDLHPLYENAAYCPNCGARMDATE